MSAWVGGSWRSGVLALCFFVPAQVLEGRTPSFQMFDWVQVGLTISCNPCPALPCCPAALPARPHALDACLVGRLDGWTAGRFGLVDGLDGRASGWVGGWKGQRRVRNGASPEHPLFLTSSGKTRVGIGNARG